MYKILIIEDDVVLRETIVSTLEEKGYLVDGISSKAELLEKDVTNYNLLILDIQLPDSDGISICIDVRKQSDIPILFLTADNLEETTVSALESGGDDYMIKPFRVMELFARIRALLRRSKQEVYTIGDLRIDVDNYQVYSQGKIVPLTAMEYIIIFAFIKHRTSVLTRSQLLDIIAEESGNVVEDNTLTVHVKRIRGKLGKYKGVHYIQTVRGIGYRLYEDA